MTEFENPETPLEISPLQVAKNRFEELVRTPSDTGSLVDALKETEITGIRSGESILELHTMLADMANQAATVMQNTPDADQFTSLQQEHQKIADALRPPTPARRREKQPSKVGSSTGRAAG